jgi:16S rRNA U516 pseudouridylate synthase RsuA-like enzyme
VRVRIMHIRLGDLPSGRWRELTEAESRPLKGLAASRPRA